MGDDAIINIAAEPVEDDQTGPLGDREKTHLIGPVASTIPFLFLVWPLSLKRGYRRV